MEEVGEARSEIESEDKLLGGHPRPVCSDCHKLIQTKSDRVVATYQSSGGYSIHTKRIGVWHYSCWENR